MGMGLGRVGDDGEWPGATAKFDVQFGGTMAYLSGICLETSR
jgi:hypothetical protein